MSKVKCIGIIAEDNSDFESSRVIIKRICKRDNISFKKAIGNGCGKLRRKAGDFAVDLNKRGCNLLILIHDLDRNNLEDLRKDLSDKLKNSPITNKIICIPIEEMEAWFLSDPDGIKECFNLKRAPKISGNPEFILSPKEKLEELVYLCSEKNTIYLNTQHNKRLAEFVSIDKMKAKCKGFNELHEFISIQKF